MLSRSKLLRRVLFPDAESALQGCRAAFDAAVTMNPDDPQAYANFAQALHNSNQLVEAVEMWDKVIRRVDSSVAASIRTKQRQSQFGVHSKDRDEAYQAGRVRHAYAAVPVPKY